MSKMILDSSAILAVICDEEGADVVAAHSNGAIVSTVNLAEVYSKSADIGLKLEELHWAVSRLNLIPAPLSHESAMIVGSLREATRKFGLSLGDRACLGLAIETRLPVLTADRTWKDLNIGVNVKTIRAAKRTQKIT